MGNYKQIGSTVYKRNIDGDESQYAYDENGKLKYSRFYTKKGSKYFTGKRIEYGNY